MGRVQMRNTFHHLEKIRVHDFRTYRHSLRVAMISVSMGKQIGLTKEELVAVEEVALLHDYGKIRVAGEILRKAGTLTPEERLLVEKHPYYGAVMAADIPPHLRLAILGHHERFDGDGYPTGLKGEDIPYIARIIAIADSYDAMVSVRPYGRLFSHEEAIKEILRCSGTQFDPYLVRFLKGQSEVLAINKAQPSG